MQQDLVRQTLTATGWTRNRLAEELAVTKRRIDSWLLPSESRQGRAMDLSDHRKVEAVLIEALKRQAAIKGGRRNLTNTTGEPRVFCEQANIYFPTLYRAIVLELDTDELKGLVKNTNVQVVSYSLDPAELMLDIPGLKPPLIEPISHLDPELDLDCVSITHLRNQDEAMGFDLAASHLSKPEKGFCTYEIDGKLFGLFRYTAPTVNTARLIYRAQFFCGGLIPEGIWSLTVMPDGTKEIKSSRRHSIIIKQPPNKFIAREAMMRGNASQNGGECTQPERVVVGCSHRRLMSIPIPIKASTF